ncbi:helix-turn-helix domain-containing protein [Flavobacterium sp. MK4S-17]|uniref:helix-turn-helix domain-containing protein n=1 Tax=Flavobacterium sp. MK4S-17 TaxID=2543737 RepID=UPI00135BA15C|nr:helix-turn-helix domain-containing protein [Flavobacterium sp. MK4S-17]
MGQTILLHEISPEDLQEMIRQAVREELNSFLSELKVQKDDSDVLLSRAEASELLKVSLTTLWNWTKSNKVISYGMGNRIFYKKKELLESLTKLRYR